MDYITIKEASEKWCVTTRAITYQVVAGLIPGTIKMGNLWLIPTSAAKPADRRYKNNRSIKKAETVRDEKNENTQD